MNVVMTGDGRFVEVQGTAEGAPFDRDRARRAARPRDGRLRRPDRAAADGRSPPPARERLRVTRRLVLATRNAHKVRELRADPRRPGRRARARGRRGRRRRGAPDVAETGVTFARERPAQGARSPRPPGCRRSPTTPGSRSTCSAASPGVFSRPLVGAGRPRRRRDRANLELLLAQLADVPDEHRGGAPSSAPRRSSCPTGGERVEGRVDGRLVRARRAAPTASATTRSSCPTGTAPPRR